MSELNEDDILMLDDGELFVTKVSYDALRAELEQAQADVKKWITHFEKEAARHDETIASVARLRAALEDVERLGRNANKNNKLAVHMGDVARAAIATLERTDVDETMTFTVKGEDIKVKRNDYCRSMQERRKE